VTRSTRIKRVALLQAGGTPSVDDPSMWAEDGTPWIAIGDMTKAPVVTTSERSVSPAGIASKRLPIGQPGAVLFAMYASLGEVATLGIQATWNQAILGIEPLHGLASPRFIAYWLEHLQPTLGALARSNTQDNLNAEQVGNLPFPVLDVAAQEATAEYLDRETARIDALLAKKRRMIEAVEERCMSSLPVALAERGFDFPTTLAPDWSRVSLPRAWRVVRLSQVLRQLTNGYVGPTRDILRDSGIRYVQSLHIKNGVIDFARRPFFVDESWHRERPRIHLRSGDVLIVQTGDIGRIAVVPEGFGQASCHALQIARVNPAMLSGEYLGAYLRSPFGYESLLSRATGALHPHLEGGIRDVPIVVPPRTTQDEVLGEITHESELLNSLTSVITHQIDLLVEHRQALITAAVAGELEIGAVAAA
jgi:type I restriction enzyme S subunit